jgi:hypothetical protein
MGFARPRNVVVWGFSPARRDALVLALDRFAGETFVDRSWTKPSVDSVLTQAEVKTVLGAFAVAHRGRAISVDPQWERQNIIEAELPIIGKVRCHRVIVPALQSALLEIEQGGMAAAIDVRDTQQAGGCFSSRLIRSETGAAGRNLSRHSWAGTIDINPSSNAFGAAPQMSPVIVEVFRRHGFAWGGTWDEPDGMHFEFVGKPRVSGPRLPVVPTTTSTTTTSTTTTTTTTTSTVAPTTTTTVASTTTRSVLPATTPEPAVVTTSTHVPTSSTGSVGASTTSEPVPEDPVVGPSASAP